MFFILKKWTNEECNILICNYKKLNNEELMKLLPNRSWSSILTKANKLHLNKRQYWSKQEDELLIEVYEKLDIDEVVKMFPNRNKNAIIKRAMLLNLNSFNHIIWTKEQEKYLIDNWILLPDIIIAKNINKTKNAVKRKRHLLGLYRQNKNQLTYENIAKFIRGNIYQWKIDSMKQCNYSCVLTKSKNFQIHHLYPVNKIINDVFTKYNIQHKQLSDYTSHELQNIIQLFNIEQAKHPLGECVRKDLHILFHSLYGQYNTTIEQWKQFKIDYKNGVYKNYNNINIVA